MAEEKSGENGAPIIRSQKGSRERENLRIYHRKHSRTKRTSILLDGLALKERKAS